MIFTNSYLDIQLVLNLWSHLISSKSVSPTLNHMSYLDSITTPSQDCCPQVVHARSYDVLASECTGDWASRTENSLPLSNIRPHIDPQTLQKAIFYSRRWRQSRSFCGTCGWFRGVRFCVRIVASPGFGCRLLLRTWWGWGGVMGGRVAVVIGIMTVMGW